MERSEAVKKAKQAWVGMIRRCNDPRMGNYKYYGGRGIYVCEKWVKSFQEFVADIGLPSDPKESLGRINNNAGYTPGNCRWENHKQQANNRSNSVVVEIYGVKKTVSQWIEIKKIDRAVVWSRIRRGMSPYLAITKPIRKKAIKRENSPINRGSCESG